MKQTTTNTSNTHKKYQGFKEEIKMRKTVYENIYTKLEKLGITDLKAYKKIENDPYMPLSIDILQNNKEQMIIALAHNYIQNGDVMADPDMEIRIYKETGMAEALTYQQDSLGLYQRVYMEKDGKTFVNTKLKNDLNVFLNRWLKNLIEQGFSCSN